MNAFASRPARAVKELGIFIAWQLRHPARTLASKPMLTVIPRSVRDVRTRRARHCCTPREFHMFEERRIARGQNDRQTDDADDATPLLPSTAPVDSVCAQGGKEGAFIGSSPRPFVRPFCRSFSCRPVLPGNNNGPLLSLFSARNVGSLNMYCIQCIFNNLTLDCFVP